MVVVSIWVYICYYRNYLYFFEGVEDCNKFVNEIFCGFVMNFGKMVCFDMFFLWLKFDGYCVFIFL